MWCASCCLQKQSGRPQLLHFVQNLKCSCLLLCAGAQDFIFVGQGATATNFGVVPDKQANGCCASDHKPIVAEVAF
jgi:hypothetical protein